MARSTAHACPFSYAVMVLSMNHSALTAACALLHVPVAGAQGTGWGTAYMTEPLLRECGVVSINHQVLQKKHIKVILHANNPDSEDDLRAMSPSPRH